MSEKIEHILSKYPCDANGIMTVGIDFLRHDLERAFGKRKVKLIGGKRQCCFEKPDGKGGVLYCVLQENHVPRKHEFWGQP